MQKLIDQLYHLAYNPLVTPACLVKNIKLGEYDELTFRKHEQGLVAIMECNLDGIKVEYIYFFDAQDNLKRVISVNLSANHEKVIFDRAEEIKTLESRIISSQANKEQLAV